MSLLTQYKLWLFLLILSSNVLGQSEAYKYRRALENVEEQWHKISLPNEIYSKTNQGLSDLRIMGFNASGDTIQAPYVWNQNRNKQQTKKIAFELLNESQKDGNFYFTFKIPSKKAIDEISLNFGEDNFDWRIKLEGSQDQKEWFKILEDYRVLGIKNEYTDYKYSEVNFPKSSYQFYRLEIPSDKKPRLINSTISISERQEGALQDIEVINQKISENKKLKRTEIEIDLATTVFISNVEIEVLDQFDYNRAISIQYLSDSVKTEKGWKTFYSNLSNGTLNSKKKNKFYFADKRCRKLKIILFNQDNQALNIGAVKVQAYRYELITRISQKADYFLYYGNEKAKHPLYDIKNFDIPLKAKNLSLGKEEKIEIAKFTNAPLFTNRLWLWILMILIIFVLGFFTLKMMKDQNAR